MAKKYAVETESGMYFAGYHEGFPTFAFFQWTFTKEEATAVAKRFNYKVVRATKPLTKEEKFLRCLFEADGSKKPLKKV